jgi:hypothetical protein
MLLEWVKTGAGGGLTSGLGAGGGRVVAVEVIVEEDAIV